MDNLPLIGGGLGVLVVGGLTFLPALALGPVIEHLQMLVAQLYA